MRSCTWCCRGATIGFRYTVREPGGELLHLAGALAAGFGCFHVLLVGARCVPVALFQQHAEVGADHAVAIPLGGHVVAAGCGVLRDLAEDPWVRRCGTA